MPLKEDLENKVAEIFGEQWTERNGQVVPDASDLKLNNDAVKLDCVVLYADMSESTKLVDRKKAFFAAEVYKTYLHCAAKVIRAEGGEITSYDGDRIMAVFIGDSKNTSAARAALKINYTRLYIVNPAITEQYPKSDQVVKHTVGIDSCKLFIARTGIRGSNDLVWVGRAANHAAKLCELSNKYPTRITKEVYDNLHSSVIESNGESMWEQVNWTEMDRTIYRSTWYWKVN